MHSEFLFLKKELFMKFSIRLTSILLCLMVLVSLAGCQDNTAVTEPDDGTLPPVDPKTMYAAARLEIDNSPDLQLIISMEQQRTVGDETYSHQVNALATYSGLHTDSLSAIIDENFSFGTYDGTYSTFYKDSVAYSQTMDFAFSTPMAADTFLAEQLPAILLDASLYSTITAETTSVGTTIRFANSGSLERWLADPSEVQFISAEGAAVLNKNGKLLSTSYTAKYLTGEVTHCISVSVSVSIPASNELSLQFPQTLDTATTILHFQTPRLLFAAVGDICATQKLSGSYTETLYCEAADSIRKQQVNILSQGIGAELYASVDFATTLTNYAGNAETNTQTELYENGIYSYSMNGGKPTVLQNVTAEQMRTYCEDTILSALLSIDYLGGAQLVDNGETYTLKLTGTEAMADALCDSIYTILNLDLDETAQSYTTNKIGGYLTLDKVTGLPLEAGIFLTRIHVIGGSTYTMTYQLDETISLYGE